jgi:hypothetical protein
MRTTENHQDKTDSKLYNVLTTYNLRVASKISLAYYYESNPVNKELVDGMEIHNSFADC